MHIPGHPNTTPGVPIEWVVCRCSLRNFNEMHLLRGVFHFCAGAPERRWLDHWWLRHAASREGTEAEGARRLWGGRFAWAAQPFRERLLRVGSSTAFVNFGIYGTGALQIYWRRLTNVGLRWHGAGLGTTTQHRRSAPGRDAHDYYYFLRHGA